MKALFTLLSHRIFARFALAGFLVIFSIALLYQTGHASAAMRIVPTVSPTVLPTGGISPTATDTVVPTTTATATTTASATPTTPTVTPSATPTPSGLPRYDHIVVVIEENKDYAQLIGTNTPAAYINSLLSEGMLFTNSHAITHPSQPNYLDLFSGSDQGVNGDACSASGTFPQPDLGGQLISAGFSFAGYSESMPSAGYTGCYDTPTSIGSLYARKHNPWANFTDVNGSTTNLTYSSFPTTSAGFSKLPTVSFVIPNLQDDMHDGSVQQGDTWLKQNLSAYVEWARTNNSLFILTTDEEDESNGIESNPNQVATIFVGQHVQVGTNNANISHYSVLRTLEDMYGLMPANNAATASDITGIWN